MLPHRLVGTEAVAENDGGVSAAKDTDVVGCFHSGGHVVGVSVFIWAFVLVDFWFGDGNGERELENFVAYKF